MILSLFRHNKFFSSSDNKKALGWALAVHLLILLGLVLGLNRQISQPGPIQIELWTSSHSSLSPLSASKPQPSKPHHSASAAKSASKVEATASKTPSLPPEPKIQAPDIALEKARLEQEHKLAEQQEKHRLKKARLAAEKLAFEALAKEKASQEAKQTAMDKAKAEKLAVEKTAADKLVAEKLVAEKAAVEKLAAEKLAMEKANAEKQVAQEKAKKLAATEALRRALREDALSAAGIQGGTADRNQAGGGKDNGYGGRVRACIQAGVAYPAPARYHLENPTAQYRVQVDVNGQVSDVTLVRSSGHSGFDRAVENGIRRCKPFPRPSTGRQEPIIDIIYKMYD